MFCRLVCAGDENAAAAGSVPVAAPPNVAVTKADVPPLGVYTAVVKPAPILAVGATATFTPATSAVAAFGMPILTAAKGAASTAWIFVVLSAELFAVLAIRGSTARVAIDCLRMATPSPDTGDVYVASVLIASRITVSPADTLIVSAL